MNKWGQDERDLEQMKIDFKKGQTSEDELKNQIIEW
jgi:hypothetical protein